MPQGEGTYGSKVGRPSKKRTSYVNDNGWTRRYRKQSGTNPERGQSDHIVGETIRQGADQLQTTAIDSVKEWNDKKIAQQREQYGPNIWDEGFSKGIDKIVDFSKKAMSGYYNHTKYPGKPHFSDEK